MANLFPAQMAMLFDFTRFSVYGHVRMLRGCMADFDFF